MKKLWSLLLLLSLVLQTVFLSACTQKGTQKNKYSSYSFDYFDTVTSITGYEETQEEFDKISAEIMSELEEYHRLFTIYDRYEGLKNLCSINTLTDGQHTAVTVDKRIIDMLIYARDMHDKTNGKVNVAMGSVLSVWHEYREAGRLNPEAASLPSKEILEAAAAHTDINDMIIDEEHNTVFLSDPKMSLDVGAIAKGYAVEMVAAGLEARGISEYVINVGGNVRTIGTRGDGSSWTVGIENPNSESDEAYIALLSLNGQSLVTSGSYQRYYTVEGKNYHHIINPNTLVPAETYTSVSVVCNSSAVADALSTALFCMTPEDGLALVEAWEGVEAMWLLNTGEIRYSSGFSNYITN